MRTFNLTGDNMYLGSNKVEAAYKGSELIFGNPPLVFPSPPQYHGSPTYAHFFGAGEVNRYVGSQASLVTSGMTLQENGLLVGSDRLILPEPSSLAHKRTGIYEFTIENNFDHLEPGDSMAISWANGATQFSYTSWNLSLRKDEDGNNFTTIGDVDVPMDDRDYIHIAVRHYADASNASYREVNIYINGILRQSLSRSTYAATSGLGAVTIRPRVPIYDFKVYRGATDASIITNNHNYISELKFIKTNQL